MKQLLLGNNSNTKRCAISSAVLSCNNHHRMCLDRQLRTFLLVIW